MTAQTDAYRVAFLSPRGDTLRTVSRGVAPVGVRDSEWTASQAEYAEFRGRNPNASCDPASPERIREKPVTRNLFFDEAGNLWVEYRSAEGDMLDVFGRTGGLLGTLVAPAHEVPLQVRAGRLYTITVGEVTGTQGVTVYRIVRQ